MMHSFLLISCQFEHFTHAHNDKRDQKSAPKGRYHDYDTADVGERHEISETHCSHGHDYHPNRLEIIIKVNLLDGAVVFYFKDSQNVSKD